jgi:hypothetical protein
MNQRVCMTLLRGRLLTPGSGGHGEPAGGDLCACAGHGVLNRSRAGLAAAAGVGEVRLLPWAARHRATAVSAWAPVVVPQAVPAARPQPAWRVLTTRTKTLFRSSRLCRRLQTAPSPATVSLRARGWGSPVALCSPDPHLGVLKRPFMSLITLGGAESPISGRAARRVGISPLRACAAFWGSNSA